MVHMCVMVESVSFAYLGSLSLKMATGALAISTINYTYCNQGLQTLLRSAFVTLSQPSQAYSAIILTTS